MPSRLTKLAPLVLPLAAGLAACSAPSHASRASAESALTAPGLGTAQSFAVLGGATITNTGLSTVVGDLGVAPGTAVTGFPPGLLTGGSMHVADAIALQAKSDLTSAYDELAAEPCTRDLTGTDLGGLTLGQGVFCFSSSAQLTGTLTLDAKGKPDAVFIFKTVSTLTTASNASEALINGGSGCNVFWKVGSSATVGTNTVFVGSILALTSVALQTGARVDGRALARNGEVTMDDNHVALSTCTAIDAGAIDAGAIDTGEGDSGTADSGIADTATPPCVDTEGYCY